MASKLWAYGKRLTLWGALVSSLPVLFFPLMFISLLGIAFSVPLGCSVAIYVCIKKCYYTLFKEEVEVQMGLGIKGSEAGEETECQEEKYRLGETTMHEVNGRKIGEESQGVSFGEGEAPLVEKLIPHEEVVQKGDEKKYQLEEDWSPYEEVDTLQWEVQEEQLEPVDKQGPEVETHKDEVGEAQLEEKLYTDEEEEEGLQGEREAKDLAFDDEAHYSVKDEEKVSEGEAQLKWEAQEEKENGILASPQEENARQDQAETQSSLMEEVEVEVEVEVKVDSSEGEAQSDHSHGSTGENIGTKHKRIEEQDENNENHKIREVEDKEQDESNEVQEVPYKRSRHEESLELPPSTLYTEYTSTETIPEVTPGSGQQSMQAESTVGASNLGGENGEPIEDDNVAAELPIPPSSEVLVSSASESDKDSKSLSEGAVKEDTEDAEHIWEEIHALRNIIGYKEDPHPLYVEEIKALYVLTGIEPPPSLKYSVDLDRAKEKLKVLKLVYGVK